MILGAGLGTRLKPFTTLYPKPLIPVLGVPCIDYSVLALTQAQVPFAAVNIHAHADQMRAHLQKISKRTSLKIGISDESALLLGSAGGFRKALPLFKNQSFYSLNADVLSAVNLSALAARHASLRKERGVVMTLTLLRGQALARQTESYTEIKTDSKTGLIIGLGEKKNNVPFFTGVAVFEPEAFAALPENRPADFVSEVLKPWMGQGKVGFFDYDGIWLDVGSPELWWKAHQELAKRAAQNSLPSGWAELIQIAQKTADFHMNEPWPGWIQYGKDATPQNLLGKSGIQLDTLIYEIPV